MLDVDVDLDHQVNETLSRLRCSFAEMLVPLITCHADSNDIRLLRIAFVECGYCPRCQSAHLCDSKGLSSDYSTVLSKFAIAHVES